jgi:hypothetical protein
VTGAVERRYRFGDSSQPGVLLGLSISQAVPVVSGVLWLALCLQTPLSAPVGLIGAGCGLVVAFGRWRGAPITEILMPSSRLWVRRRLRRHRWHRPVVAATTSAELPEPLPPVLAGIDIIELPIADDAETSADPVGVVRDTRAGTLTAVLHVSGDGFPLAPAGEQDTMLDAWGATLSPFARQGCLVTRIASHHWARPLATPAARDRSGDPSDEALADYLALADQQAAVSMTHQVLIAVTVDQRRVRTRGQRHGSRLESALVGLAEEMELFRSRLEVAGLRVHGPLSRSQLAAAIRERSDPSCSAQLAILNRSLAAAAWRVPQKRIEWGPMVVEAAWRQVRVDGAWHRTYRIANWPPLPVPPDWLGPLITEPGVTRSVSVVMEPVPLVESARRADREAMAREADAESKGRRGFRISARDHKRIAEVEERERELAQGHAEFRFVGLVDVSALSEAALADAAAALEQAAARSLIDLRPLEARHDQAWVACLPLGRDITTRSGLAS